ncbi:hypothetical protein TWF718_009762 [Orbilia javanica]|uniref:F-box domain-containing protein n=1 Tax=Orbilia javanica TaxID=47235 RepID=A0AAN8MWX7_9PEZI
MNDQTNITMNGEGSGRPLIENSFDFQAEIDGMANTSQLTGNGTGQIGLESGMSGVTGACTSDTGSVQQPVVPGAVAEAKMLHEVNMPMENLVKSACPVRPEIETPANATETPEFPWFKPFERVPNELLSRIFQHLDARDLAAISLTCRPFCQSAMPILYSTLSLEASAVRVEREDVGSDGEDGEDIDSDDEDDDDNNDYDDDVQVVVVEEEEQDRGKFAIMLQNPHFGKWLRHLSWRIRNGLVLDQGLENALRDETLNLAKLEATYLTSLETEAQLFDMIVDLRFPTTLKKLIISFDGYQSEHSFYTRIQKFETEFVPQMLCLRELSLGWIFKGRRAALVDAFLILVAIWAEFLDSVPNVQTVELFGLGLPRLKGPRPTDEPVARPIPQRIKHVVKMMDQLVLPDLKGFSVVLDPVAHSQRFELPNAEEPKLEPYTFSIFQVLNRFLSRHRGQLLSFLWRGPLETEGPEAESLVTVKVPYSLCLGLDELGTEFFETKLGKKYFTTTAVDNRECLRVLELAHVMTTSK